MMNDIQPNLRQYLVRDSLVLDILPYMIEILQPHLRQVRRSMHFFVRSSGYLDKHRSVHEQRITRYPNSDRCDDRLQSLVHSAENSHWRECPCTRTVSRRALGIHQWHLCSLSIVLDQSILWHSFRMGKINEASRLERVKWSSKSCSKNVWREIFVSNQIDTKCQWQFNVQWIPMSSRSFLSIDARDKTSTSFL